MGKRSSPEFRPRLQKAQAISIDMTTVFPEPVAILQPNRVNGSKLGFAGASISLEISVMGKSGLNRGRFPLRNISAR